MSNTTHSHFLVCFSVKSKQNLIHVVRIQLFRFGSFPTSEISTTISAEVGGILDYAAEAKDGELPETVKPIDEEDGVHFFGSGTVLVVGSEIR